MGYLVITRREDESINLRIDPKADITALIQQLTTDGINIDVIDVHKNQVRFGIEAPRDVTVLRTELLLAE